MEGSHRRRIELTPRLPVQSIQLRLAGDSSDRVSLYQFVRQV
jgi:hypothetical protein